MKKICSIIVAVLMVASFAFAGGSKDSDPVSTIQKRGVLKVGVKEDVPKFGYLNPETNTHEGFEIDLAKAIAKELLGDETKVKFTGVSAKTRGPLLDTGELDIVIATFTVTDERKLSYEFSEIYFTDAVALMVKTDSGIKSFKDLEGKTVGVAQSATTKKSLQAAAEKDGVNLKFAEYTTYPELKTALDSKRIDCFSVDEAILLGYVEPSVVILDDKFSLQPYGAAMKKGNTTLLDEVNAVIKKLDESGELEAMLVKNGLK